MNLASGCGTCGLGRRVVGIGATPVSADSPSQQDGDQEDMPESTRADRAHANTIQDDRKRAAGPTPLAELRLAPGTGHACDRALLGLDRWLDGRPLTDGSLADCLGALFDRGLAAASAETAVAAATERARRAGEASPAGARTRGALSAFRRDGAGRGPGQVVGIRWGQADRMARLAESCGNARGLRDALLIRIMSDCLLRVLEAEALDVSDVEFVRDGLLVTIRRSKTDQEGRGAALLAGPETARLARKWLGTARIDGGAAVPAGQQGGAGGGPAPVGAQRQGHRQETRGGCRDRGAGVRPLAAGGLCAVAAGRRRHRDGTDGRGSLDAGRHDGGIRAGAGRRVRAGGAAALRRRAAGCRRARRPTCSAPRSGARRGRGGAGEKGAEADAEGGEKVEKRLARIERAVTGS